MIQLLPIILSWRICQCICLLFTKSLLGQLNSSAFILGTPLLKGQSTGTKNKNLDQVQGQIRDWTYFPLLVLSPYCQPSVDLSPIMLMISPSLKLSLLSPSPVWVYTALTCSPAVGGGGGGAVIPRVAGKVPVKSTIISLNYIPSSPSPVWVYMALTCSPAVGGGGGEAVIPRVAGNFNSCKINNNFIRLYFFIPLPCVIEHGLDRQSSCGLGWSFLVSLVRFL